MCAVLNSTSDRWNIVERLCFPAPKPSYDIRSYPDELILVPREDGIKIPCLFLPFKHARFLIIYFHGNAEDLGLCYNFCTIVRDLFQVHLLAVEYPGYGICDGPCSEQGIMANALAAMRFAIETLKWPQDGIKLLGRSLGTGPTCALAAKFEVAGVILVTPFLSIKEIFRSQVGSMADFITERFPNHELAPNIESPTLIIHGQQDTLIPLAHGKQIYDSIPAKKMMVCPALMGHNTSLLANVGTFVLPMTQFFSLPDYTFEDIEVPEWAFPDSNVEESVPQISPAGTEWRCGQNLMGSQMKKHEVVGVPSGGSKGGRNGVGLAPGIPIGGPELALQQPTVQPKDQAVMPGMAHAPNMTPRTSNGGPEKFEGDALTASRQYSFRSPPPTPRDSRAEVNDGSAGSSTSRYAGAPASAQDAKVGKQNEEESEECERFQL
jgi:pimeloyl-ACP methyl ester carboxylesterase